MKHGVKAKHFNRDNSSRKALLKNLLRALFEHGEIKSSEARIKETKRLADKMISKALENTSSARRELHKFFGRRDVVNSLIDQIAPAVGDKKSGFTTVKKIAARRGDNTVVFKLSLLTGDKKVTSFKKEKVTVEKAAETEVKQEAKAAPKKTAVKKAPAKKTSVKKAKKSEENK